MLLSNEEISKIEKTSKSFSSPWWTSQSLTKASFFPINLSVFRKHVCQMSRSSPWGMLKPSPRGWDKIVNVPLPGLTTSANAPWLSWGIGIAGIDWPVLIAVQKNYFRSRRVQKICWISIFFQAQSFIKLHWLNGLTYREICRAQYENAILVRPCGPSIVNRTQSNSIELNSWIDYNWVRQSNQIELTQK